MDYTLNHAHNLSKSLFKGRNDILIEQVYTDKCQIKGCSTLNFDFNLLRGYNIDTARTKRLYMRRCDVAIIKH